MEYFLERFSYWVKTEPDRVALTDGKIDYSYEEVDVASDLLAKQLVDGRHGENDLIGFLGHMSPECVILLIACIKAGTAVMYLDPGNPIAVSEELVQHAGIVRIATWDRHTDLARSLVTEEPIILTQHKPTRAEVGDFVSVENEPEAISFVTYTSGSTGKPKGVVVSRKIADIRIRQLQELHPVNKEDIVGTFNVIWWDKQVYPLTEGAKVAVYNVGSDGPQATGEWLREQKATSFFLFTAMYRQIVAAADRPFPDIRRVGMGGERLRLDDLEQFNRCFLPGTELDVRYSCQEFCAMIVYKVISGEPLPEGPLPLGTIRYPENVRLLDEQGNKVGVGTPGEISVIGDFVPAGYHNDPERSAGVFREEENGLWSCTHGDLAYVDTDGLVYPLGRKDEQVKIRGYNVRPPEIESILMKHPDIAGVAVSAFEGEQGIRRLACFYVLKPDAENGKPDLRGYLSKIVPGYMVPNHYFELDKLPVTTSGKLKRSELPNPLDLISNDGTDRFEDASETEKKVAEIWKNVLGHTEFGPSDEFFDVGGDSLQAMSVLVLIEQEYHIRIPLDMLFLNGSSVRSMSVQVSDALKGHDASVPVVLKKGQGRTPIYAIHVRGGHLSDYFTLFPGMHENQPIFGIHPRGMDDETKAGKDLSDVAEHIADVILNHDTDKNDIRLMGYSFGAHAAFEAARILESKGVKVTRVILIDPLAKMGDKMGYIRSMTGSVKTRQGRSKVWTRMTSTVPYALGLRGTPNNLFEVHMAAMLRYKPKPLKLDKVLLVRADENPDRELSKKVWTKLLHGNVDIIDHPGTHIKMMRVPNGEPLGRKIDAWLNDQLPA